MPDFPEGSFMGHLGDAFSLKGTVRGRVFCVLPWLVGCKSMTGNVQYPVRKMREISLLVRVPHLRRFASLANRLRWDIYNYRYLLPIRAILYLRSVIWP